MTWQQLAAVAYTLLPAVLTAAKGVAPMGYRKPTKTYHLVWDDGDMAGFEMRIKALSVGAMLDLAGTAAIATASPVGGIDGVFEPFAGALIEWNLEDEQGVPVPATLEGVRGQDLGFVMKLVMKWMSAMSDVGNPLPGTSNSGGTSPPPSLGLVNASESLAS